MLSGNTNSVDPDQTAASGAIWSGSALFAYHILSETLVYRILGHLPYFITDCEMDSNGNCIPHQCPYPQVSQEL